MAKDLLFELGTEELPSKAVKTLGLELAQNFQEELQKRNLKFKNIESFATPRRLAVRISDLAEKQDEQILQKKGPSVEQAYKDGKPTQALLGFAKSLNISVNDLTIIKTDKGHWYGLERVEKGKFAVDLLPEIIHEAIKKLTLTKPMRWGDGDATFARPVHWVLCILGDKIVHLNLFNIDSSNLTYGHRFHSPGSIKITDASLYEEKLKEAFVIASFEKRKNFIAQEINKLANEHNLEFNSLQMNESSALLEEVCSIVEWPVPILCRFDEEFLQIPHEALISSMISHQKCFPIYSSNSLAPYFITVSNIASKDIGKVRLGNEKVMRARLKDAAFFYHSDQKQPLLALYEGTAQVLFQAKLGNLQDKTNRMAVIMQDLARNLNLAEKDVTLLAKLSKCDLLTGMVNEFPELQGVMGSYYAAANHPSHISVALKEQYLPKFANDLLPETKYGSLLSLADRLDTMVGIFGIGLKPTGEKDPFKLRRHALALVRILTSFENTLSLNNILTIAYQNYAKLFSSTSINELKAFILERLQSYYLGQNVSAEIIEAARSKQDDCLYDLDIRIKALQKFIISKEAQSLAASCKRVCNILQKTTIQKEVSEELLKESAELELYQSITGVELILKPYFASQDYEQILTELAKLKDVIDIFFDKVMVMVDDENLKLNRLSLLSRLKNLLNSVADISLLSQDLKLNV